MDRETLLLNMFSAMQETLGNSEWWPADSSFEVMVGAVLTQNTNWKNVEKAIANLKEANMLSPETMLALSQEDLAALIRPAGYYNIKAKRLQNLLQWFKEASDFSFDDLQHLELEDLRAQLLSVNGVGQETADSILLYAFNRPSFVVDAYTRRIFNRHGLVEEDMYYDDLRDFFMDVLPEDTALFNEYHAGIVRIAKEWCVKKEPRCATCPLCPFLDNPPCSMETT
ncbi:MAG: endonuclease III domain-containing protein [Desulfovibrionales bacterium]|nr:endonuclease III domain-containing protein [Desulfovibrionales bacterium]